MFVPRTVPCFYCLPKQQFYVVISCPSNHSKMSFLVKSTVPSWRNNNSMFSLLVPTVICCHWWLKKIVVLIVLLNNSSNCFHDLHKNNSQINYKFLLFAKTSMLNVMFALLAQAIMSNFHCLPKQKVYDCITSKQHFPVLIACPYNSSTFLMLAQK